MRKYLAPTLLVALFGALIAFALISTGVRPAALNHSRVKLAVLVVFDQMRGDYPERWRPLYGQDGFVRIQNEGMWFTHCNYPYATTTTGPGHASILSGTCGDRHGIINNDWFERGASVYCAGSNRYEFVPPLTITDPKAKAKPVGNPDRMLAQTVADVLKAQYPRSKVFGLSLKDRSAILPTGKKPDGAYWFDGKFITSTYYADRVHPWVERFNNSGTAEQWFGKDWTHFRTDIDYTTWSGPDIAPGEGKGIEVKEGPAKGWSQKIDFPHPNTGGRDKPGKEYYEALANSPFGNDLLLAFAKECITAERLGEDDIPDFLVVSFSSNDLIGHTWGPDSQEVLDVTLRSDALMGDFLRFLDSKVGTGNYLLGITADHGICPLVEASQARGIDAKRVDVRDLQKAIEANLTAKFSPDAAKTAWVEALSFPWVYFNTKALTAAGKTRIEAATETAAYLQSRPDIGRAFTRTELTAQIPASDVIATRVSRSFHPDRSGDVCIVLKEWYLPSSPLLTTGTTHGAPYDYDTHVPLMLIGPGIEGGAKPEPTTPQAMTAIFAKWLGTSLPNRAEFPLPPSLTGR